MRCNEIYRKSIQISGTPGRPKNEALSENFLQKFNFSHNNFSQLTTSQHVVRYGHQREVKRGYMQPDKQLLTVTIASAATASEEIDCRGFVVAGIQLPATMTGATVKFQAAVEEGGTYQDVYDADGNLVNFVSTGGRFVSLFEAGTKGLPFIKLVSASAEGADREIKLVMVSE